MNRQVAKNAKKENHPQISPMTRILERREVDKERHGSEDNREIFSAGFPWRLLLALHGSKSEEFSAAKERIRTQIRMSSDLGGRKIWRGRGEVIEDVGLRAN